MRYYAFIDGSQQGPFSLDQLAEAGVRPSTYIWCKGMDDWHRADEVEEVRNHFRSHLDNAEQAKRSRAVEAEELPRPQDSGANGANGYPDEPDLSDIPQSYRGFVRKSGEIPGPSNSMEPDINHAPQVSMVLAVLSMLLCFPPGGIAAVVFTYKAQKVWNESCAGDISPDRQSSLRRQSHEFARLAKMWLGFTVALGIIAWTLLFSIRP